MLKSLVEAGALPGRAFTIPELAAARAAGYLTVHDNGVLTIQYPGQSPVEAVVPLKDRRRSRRTATSPNDTEREHLADPVVDLAQKFPLGSTRQAPGEAVQRGPGSGHRKPRFRVPASLRPGLAGLFHYPGPIPPGWREGVETVH